MPSICNNKEYYSNTLPFDWPKDMQEVRKYTSSLFKEGNGLDNQIVGNLHLYKIAIILTDKPMLIKIPAPRYKFTWQ